MRDTRAAIREAFRGLMEAQAAARLGRAGVSPNLVTLLGLSVAGVDAYLIARGYLLAGGVVLVASGLLDTLDGALARATGKVSRFGALLDSAADRLGEAAVLLGALVFYLAHGPSYGAALAFAALTGSFMVSYVRARAEGLGIRCEVGLLTRPERIVALAGGLVAAQWWTPSLALVLSAVAALTLFTTAQRLAHAWKSLR